MCVLSRPLGNLIIWIEELIVYPLRVSDSKWQTGRLCYQDWLTAGKESLAVLPVVSAVSALAAKARRQRDFSCHSVAPRPPAPHHCLPDMELHCTLHSTAAAALTPFLFVEVTVCRVGRATLGVAGWPGLVDHPPSSETAWLWAADAECDRGPADQAWEPWQPTDGPPRHQLVNCSIVVGATA